MAKYEFKKVIGYLPYGTTVYIKDDKGILPEPYTTNYVAKDATVVTIRMSSGITKTVPKDSLYIKELIPPKVFLYEDFEFKTPDLNFMADLLYTKKHEDVVDLALTDIDRNKFVISKGAKYTIIVSKTIKENSPALMAHTDIHPNISHPTLTTLKIDEELMFSSNDGLGADDKAGVYAINRLLRSHPDDFFFCLFDEEERGCIGSREYVKTLHFKNVLSQKASCFISIDRRREFNGAKSLATYGYNNKELNSKVALHLDRKEVAGSSTDCKILSGASSKRQACFNMSCGYIDEHKKTERLYFSELQETVTDLKKLADEVRSVWEGFHIATKPAVKKVVKSTYGYEYDSLFDSSMYVDGSIVTKEECKLLIEFFEESTGKMFSKLKISEIQALIPESTNFTSDDFLMLAHNATEFDSKGARLISKAVLNSMKDKIFTISSFNSDDTVDVMDIEMEIELTNIPVVLLRAMKEDEPMVSYL